MSKPQIAAILSRMKRTRETLVTVSGELFSADELLSQFLGRSVGEAEAQQFIMHELDHAYL